MRSWIQTWCTGLLLTILAAGISVTWLDRPIAYFVHDAFGQFVILGNFTGTPNFFRPMAALVFLVFLARRIAIRPCGKLDIVMVLCCVSMYLAKLLLPPLKFTFGRTWPLYHQPSLIGDGVYGFNFFHRGLAYTAFPSGHTASVFALIMVFWICYPRFRPIYTAGIVAIVGALIVGDYHFLSDVIAGAFVGISTAMYAVAVWEAVGPATRSVQRWRVRLCSRRSSRKSDAVQSSAFDSVDQDFFIRDHTNDREKKRRVSGPSGSISVPEEIRPVTILQQDQFRRGDRNLSFDLRVLERDHNLSGST
jgi:membrane-associated phospholipid phosphatase